MDNLRQPIREIENVFIPMSDGARLAARIWMPETADREPVPAILEYLPYRKRDFMRTRDEPMHRYYASHGYAAVRVDLRGSGDSDGVMLDEYLPREQSDAIEVIDWLAAQPWCDGNVGMTGISWGGFNSLQVAALRPKPLKAIITLCASDDRYSDDAHYMGGCLLNENQIWGTVLFALNALPPDPLVVGEDRWRALWEERLEANHPFPARWLEHQRRDEYWKQGSVCEDFSQIECAVYAIGGWADGYTNAVPRLMEGLSSPRKGLIGPWAHAFPHNGLPGPAIGYLQEAVRWWDRWLKGVKNGIDEEPALRVWMQHGVEPEPIVEHRDGHWIAEERWPSPRSQPRTLRFGSAGAGTGVLFDVADGDGAGGDGARADIAEVSGSPDSLEVKSSQSTGLSGGVWCEFGSEGEGPRDQRPDDGGSLVFDGPPLSEPLEILGAPRVRLRVSIDRPVGLVAVRLNEVFQDGASARVTYGLLNLTHRDSHEHPTPMVPGEEVDVEVELNHIAHRFLAGSSIRLAVSTSYWPVAWPSPEAFTLSLSCSGSSLSLPVRPEDNADAQLPPFLPPESAASTSEQRPLAPTRYVRTIERDLTNHQIIYRMVNEGGDLDVGSIAHIEAIDLDLGHKVERVFKIDENDPLAAVTEIHERMMLRRDGWHVIVDARTSTTSTKSDFVVDAKLEATDHGEVVFSRQWTERIPRDLA